MSKIHSMSNGSDLLVGLAFGGDNSASSSSKKNKNSGSHLSRVETQNKLGGGVSSVDKDYPYSAYNISHNNGVPAPNKKGDIKVESCTWTSVETPGGTLQGTTQTCRDSSGNVTSRQICGGVGASAGGATVGTGSCITETY